MGSERLATPYDPKAEAHRRRSLCAYCQKSVSLDRLHSVAGQLLCGTCAQQSQSKGTPASAHTPPATHTVSTEAHGVEPEASSWRRRIVSDMRAWCEEAAWMPRAPVLALLGYWAVQHLRDPEYAGLIDALNFGVHELGHVVFAPCGEFLGIAGGTLLQLAAPLIGAAMFARQRDYFAIAFALGWLATNFYDVAVYVADAQSRSLPLLGLGAGEPIHDWYYLLSSLDLLSADRMIATSLRCVGAAAFVLALTFAGWLMLRMLLARRRRAAD